jgi:predicted TIM-barrel fold metal-dependent hydrolase
VGVVDVTVGSRSDQLLPDPEPRPVEVTIISVDDHLVEPPDMFEGRLPARFAPYQPRVVEDAEGHQLWEFDGGRYTQVGMNAVAGRRPESVSVEPTRFEDMRPGCYDIHARIEDMDINGVWASLNFPSQIAGFSGRVFSGARDPELGLAVTRAWNDWLYEEWWQPYPERTIPCGITFLSDPLLAAVEIRRNAERGFRSVSLPERPQRIGLPHLFSDYWDPIVEACEETETVISLHVGSSGQADLPDIPPGGTMMGLGATLFGQLSLAACAEWLWSGLPVRYPNVKIAMSEGGIGWVAMLLDRLDNIVTRSGYGRHFDAGGLTPADVLLRNFYFCTLDDPSTIDTRHRIGIDHIMVEVDYPHGDSTWPDTQRVIREAWGHIPVDELRKLTHQNAAALFRWPLPAVCRP